MDEFNLDGTEFIDLCDLMKLLGFAPNGAVAKHIIASGVVKVDGKLETRKRCKIRSGQIIEFQGKKALVK
jgi:ribosome-associated protein